MTIHPHALSYRTSRPSRNVPHREPHNAGTDLVVRDAIFCETAADMLAQVERAQLVWFTRRNDVVPFLQEGALHALRQLNDHIADRDADKPPRPRSRKSHSK